MARDETVDAGAITLLDLFYEPRYLIDNYQREYAWSHDDVETLVNDLWAAFSNYDDRPRRRARSEQLFLGPFVYVQADRRTRYLVDGQQRFTTLHLILLHLHRIAEACGEREAESKLHPLVYDYYAKGKPTRFRIDITERRSALEALRAERTFDTRGETLSVRNLWDRGTQLHTSLAGLIDSENCARFVDWLLTQVVMVAIKAPDRRSGYRIFESMNNRGARLTPVDLLKSYLLDKAGDEEAEELNSKWRAMLADVTAAGNDDSDTPRTFLKAALLAHWAQPDDLSRDDVESIDSALHLWVKENASLIGLNRDVDYLQFMDKLIYLASHYAMFLRATAKPDREFDLSAVYFNHANGLTNQMALLLASVQPEDARSVSRPKAALAANLLDLLFVTEALADNPTDSREFQPAINRLMPKLRTCQSLEAVNSVLEQEIPETDPFVDVPTFGMRGTNSRQVKYLLARLTAYVEEGCGRDGHVERYLDRQRPWQIEHVFANHPERYAQEFPDPVTFRSLRARLGVLLLLPASDNASYNDESFSKKIPYYARQNNLAAILDPKHREKNPGVKKFITSHDPDKLFHSFGLEPKMGKVVKDRGHLYQELCRQVWSTETLGLTVPLASVDVQPVEVTPESDTDTTSPPSKPSPTAKPRVAASGGGRPTQLFQLVSARVLSPGTKLLAEHRGTTYTAEIDDDGRIRLPSGDQYRKPDDAARIVTNTKSAQGMDFWRVQQTDGQRISLKNLYAHSKSAGLLGGTKPARR